MPEADVAAKSPEQTLSNGTILFREGDPSDVAYIVLSGLVELEKQSDAGAVSLATLGPGSIFGEMGVLAHAPRSATARARGPLTVRQIDRDAFLASLRDNPASVMPIVNQLVGRLRDANTVIERQAGDQPRTLMAGVRSILRPQKVPDAALAFKPRWIEIEERQSSLLTNGTLWGLALAVVVAVTWASLTHIDRVVVAPGKLTTSAPKIVVQPLETGVVRTVDARPGQHVNAGDVLATLDATFATADLSSKQAQFESLQAEHDRLRAEIVGAPTVAFQGKGAPVIAQSALFDRRREEYTAKLNAFSAELGELQAELRTVVAKRRTTLEQTKILDELATIRQSLLDKGVGSRVQWLDARNLFAAMQRELDALDKRPDEIASKLRGIDARRAAFMSEWQSANAKELARVERERDSVVEDIRKFERRSTLVTLVAPARSVVLEVAERTVGSVVREAETFFTLIPLDVPLQVELSLDPKDIGYVREKDRVRVKLDALSFQRHGTLEGSVIVLSENTIEVGGGQNARVVYRAMIELAAEPKLRDLPADFRLIPGMAVSGEIKVGSRRVINYFLYPILRGLDEGLREP